MFKNTYRSCLVASELWVRVRLGTICLIKVKEKKATIICHKNIEWNVSSFAKLKKISKPNYAKN